MKHSKYKYILFALLLVIIATTKVLADTLDPAAADALHRKERCYYMENKFKAELVVHTGSLYTRKSKTNGSYTDVFVNKVGDKLQNDPEDVLNWLEGSWRSHTTAGNNPVTFKGLYANEEAAGNNGTCPTYLVFQYCTLYKVWGTNDEDIANQAVDSINSDKNCIGYKVTYTHSDGTKITEEEYLGSFVHKSYVGEDVDNLKCYGDNSIFGSKDEGPVTETDEDGNIVTVEPPSIAYMINGVLVYVRIIVPILIILLGTLDLAKAALASDEEKMKKAQKDFIKRIALGVVVFFVPTIVNLVMQLGDLVWTGMEYKECFLP